MERFPSQKQFVRYSCLAPGTWQSADSRRGLPVGRRGNWRSASTTCSRTASRIGRPRNRFDARASPICVLVSRDRPSQRLGSPRPDKSMCRQSTNRRLDDTPIDERTTKRHDHGSSRNALDTGIFIEGAKDTEENGTAAGATDNGHGLDPQILQITQMEKGARARGTGGCAVHRVHPVHAPPPASARDRRRTCRSPTRGDAYGAPRTLPPSRTATSSSPPFSQP